MRGMLCIMLLSPVPLRDFITDPALAACATTGNCDDEWMAPGGLWDERTPVWGLKAVDSHDAQQWVIGGLDVFGSLA